MWKFISRRTRTWPCRRGLLTDIERGLKYASYCHWIVFGSGAADIVPGVVHLRAAAVRTGAAGAIWGAASGREADADLAQHVFLLSDGQAGADRHAAAFE